MLGTAHCSKCDVLNVSCFNYRVVDEAWFGICLRWFTKFTRISQDSDKNVEINNETKPKGVNKEDRRQIMPFQQSPGSQCVAQDTDKNARRPVTDRRGEKHVLLAPKTGDKDGRKPLTHGLLDLLVHRDGPGQWSDRGRKFRDCSNDPIESGSQGWPRALTRMHEHHPRLLLSDA